MIEPKKFNVNRNGKLWTILYDYLVEKHKSKGNLSLKRLKTQLLKKQIVAKTENNLYQSNWINESLLLIDLMEEL